MKLTRRSLVAGLSLLPGALTGTRPPVRISYFDSKGQPTGVLTVMKVIKTDSEWHAQLTGLQFDVTRRRGTEQAFSGKYAETKAHGVYQCICCFTPLFHSSTKFDSGTGWPSFWAPIAEGNIGVGVDREFGMERNEVHCRRCDAHLGHVFDDGPRPTGLRYCMNSASLNFVARPEDK